MKLAVISFTDDGRAITEKLKALYGEEVDMRDGQVREQELTHGQWLSQQFTQKVPILFVGACGIAVRMIAPFVKDKLTDSPVLVMDDRGSFVIPILSGHVGGANELAKELAMSFQAIPVITTATDTHHCFAIDLFAKEQGMQIVNKEGIAKISAMILKGQSPTVYIEKELEAYEDGEYFTIGKKSWCLPRELTRVSDKKRADILIGISCESTEYTKLYLKPKSYVLGIGCRKGKECSELESFVTEMLAECGLTLAEIQAVVSIDKKKEEKGILQLCRKYDLPFFTYTGEELMAVEGEFHSSAFVQEQVGADNVCERAVVAYCGKKESLFLPKQAKNGMTVAVGKL